MPVKRYGPIKLKNKVGRQGFEIKNPDDSPMVIQAIRVIKIPEGNNLIAVDVDWIDTEKQKNNE